MQSLFHGQTIGTDNHHIGLKRPLVIDHIGLGAHRLQPGCLPRVHRNHIPEGQHHFQGTMDMTRLAGQLKSMAAFEVVRTDQQFAGIPRQILQTGGLIGDSAADQAPVLEAFSDRSQQKATFHGEGHLAADTARKHQIVEPGACERSRCGVRSMQWPGSFRPN